MKRIVTETFLTAAGDYRRLLDAGYPEGPLLELVANRFGLNAYQRSVLYRGVMPSRLAGLRRKKTVRSVSGMDLYADGFNQLFTIANYILGRPVYIARDGFIRDAGDLFGKPFGGAATKVFLRGAVLFADFLLSRKPASLTVLLDEAVEFRPEAQELLRKAWERIDSPNLRILSSRTPDADLCALAEGLVLTADSRVIETCRVGVYDGAGRTIRARFNIELPDLRKV